MRASHWLSGAAAILLVAGTASMADEMHWQPNLETAQRVASESSRLILVHFWAPWCRPCMRMEKEVFARPETGRGLQANFVLVKLNVDDSPSTARLYGVTSLPADVILTPKGQLVAQLESPPTAGQYINQLNQIAAGYTKMSQTASASLPSQQAVAAASAPMGAPMSAVAGQAPVAANQPGRTGPVLNPAGAPVADYWPSTPARTPATTYGNANTVPSPQIPTAPPAQPNITYSGRPPAQAASSGRNIPLPPGSPPLGLDGYCPVHLVQRKCWTAGDVRFGAIHHGHTYLFASPEEQKQFLARPEAFAPVMGGQDPVRALDGQQSVAGKREFGVYYQSRVYLLADQASYERFTKNPNRYAAEALQARR